MNKKVAFIVPIYPPHYRFWKEFYQSFIDNKLNDTSDFYYVFSDEKDSELFWQFDHKIILPKDLLDRCKKNKSHMPDVKKFYSINELKNDYEYLIIADAESLIVKNVDVYDICTQYYNDKVLYWNAYESESTKFVIDTSLSRVPHWDTKEDINLYLWFNQPCIYKSSFIDDFFDKTKVFDDIDHLIFGEFDYYIYMFYLIFYKNFTVVNIWILSSGWFCECINRESFTIINDNYKKSKFLSCTQYVYNFLWLHNKDVFMIHHVDRKTDLYGRIKNFIIKKFNITQK